MRAFVLTALVLSASVTTAAQLGAQAPPRPAAAAAVPAPPLDPNAWRIDVSHSELTFTIRHFVSRVRGGFGQWSGTIVADTTNIPNGSVEVTIEAASIDTQNENRDRDLRSANFFEVEKYPTITFRSTKVEGTPNDLTVTGNLTIRGVTKPVVLRGRYLGQTVDHRGARRIGFEATTTINRLDYGVSWNRVAEGGGAMLGDEVRIDIVVAGTKPAPRPARG